MATIAVIGAGLAGLTVARELAEQHQVTVFEKSRGVGGRMATRYAEGFEFDHGAQYFTAKSPGFRGFLQPLIEQRAVATWSPRLAELDREKIVNSRQWDDIYPHYVGTPGMSSVGKWLARDLDIRLETTVARIVPRGSQCSLYDISEAQLGRFDWVVITAPAPQATALLSRSSPIRQRSETASMSGCFTLMLGFDQPLELSWQAAIVNRADISWVAVNSGKLGRADGFALVAHSTNAWADGHIDDDEESIKQHLLAECSDVVGHSIHNATFCSLHRWRYANIEPQRLCTYGLDAKRQVAACGDWFVGGRVEAAYISAVSLAETLKRLL